MISMRQNEIPEHRRSENLSDHYMIEKRMVLQAKNTKKTLNKHQIKFVNTYKNFNKC